MIEISQKIKDARLEKGLTLDEISKATKIRVSFLSAIERGEYDKLPSPAYAQGFVRNYINFLGLPEKETLALFRREFDTNKSYKILPSGFDKTSGFSLSKLRMKQTAVIIILIFAGLFLFIFYQYKDAIFNPSLDIFSPAKGAVFSSSVIQVSGKTDPNVTVFVNNIAVNVEQNGVFKKNIVALSGKTAIEIKAVNHFGKQTIVKRDVEIKSSP
jgi:cytoskeletal protein RodZ